MSSTIAAKTNDKAGIVLDGTVMRYNGGKNRLDLLPPEWAEGLASILTFGANKYAANLWRKGMPWSSPLASAQRHILAWQKGEELDPDSGLPHVLHAAVNLLFLHTYKLDGVGDDDRFIPKG